MTIFDIFINFSKGILSYMKFIVELKYIYNQPFN